MQLQTNCQANRRSPKIHHIERERESLLANLLDVRKLLAKNIPYRTPVHTLYTALCTPRCVRGSGAQSPQELGIRPQVLFRERHVLLGVFKLPPKRMAHEIDIHHGSDQDVF